MGISQLSCQKPQQGIPKNLFNPLTVVGKVWVYDWKRTDLNGNTIPGMTGTHVTKVIGMMPLEGKSAYVILDSTSYGDSTIIDTAYFHIDNEGNAWHYLLFERNDPSSGPGWIMIYNVQMDFNERHVAYETTVQPPGYTSPITITISSVIRDKISMTVPYGSFKDVYPGELQFSFVGDSINYTHVIRQFFVEDVGSIKSIFDWVRDFPCEKIGYEVRELRDKII